MLRRQETRRWAGLLIELHTWSSHKRLYAASPQLQPARRPAAAAAAAAAACGPPCSMPPLQPLAAAAPATTAQRVSLVGQPLRPQHQPQQTARHASPPPSLRAAMLAHSAAADRLTYLAGLLLNATAVFHSPLSERDRWVLSALTASLALMCVLTLAAPRHYLSVRPWLSALMRFVNAGLLPFVMDGLSVTRHDDERGWGTMARAAVVLLLPVSKGGAGCGAANVCCALWSMATKLHASACKCERSTIPLRSGLFAVFGSCWCMSNAAGLTCWFPLFTPTPSSSRSRCCTSNTWHHWARPSRRCCTWPCRAHPLRC